MHSSYLNIKRCVQTKMFDLKIHHTYANMLCNNIPTTKHCNLWDRFDGDVLDFPLSVYYQTSYLSHNINHNNG